MKVDDMIFHRGEDGNLIPQEVTLELLKDKPKITVRPLTRGKLQEIYQKAKSEDITEKVKADNDVIKEGLIEPKLTDEQITDLKPTYANAISIAIMSISLGVTQQKVQEKAEELVNEKEEELKKNLN